MEKQPAQTGHRSGAFQWWGRLLAELGSGPGRVLYGFFLLIPNQWQLEWIPILPKKTCLFTTIVRKMIWLFYPQSVGHISCVIRYQLKSHSIPMVDPNFPHLTSYSTDIVTEYLQFEPRPLWGLNTNTSLSVGCILLNYIPQKLASLVSDIYIYIY